MESLNQTSMEEINEENRDPCPICLEDLVKSYFFWKNQAVGLQPCQHYICKNCHKTLQTNYKDLAQKCPLCRTVLESTIEWLGNMALAIILICLLGLILAALIPTAACLEIMMCFGFAIFISICLAIYGIISVFLMLLDIKQLFGGQNKCWNFIIGIALGFAWIGYCFGCFLDPYYRFGLTYYCYHISGNLHE